MAAFLDFSMLSDVNRHIVKAESFCILDQLSYLLHFALESVVFWTKLLRFGQLL